MLFTERLRSLQEACTEYIKNKLDEIEYIEIDVFGSSMIFKKYDDYWLDHEGYLYDIMEYSIEVLCEIADGIHLSSLKNLNKDGN